MKTEAQYFALFAKRIQFYLDAQKNTPEKPKTAQIDEVTPEMGQVSLEQRSNEFKAFLRQSGEVANDSELSSEGSTDSKPSSETLETQLAVLTNPEKTPEEIAEAKKEVKRLMELLRNKNK
jgi:hypothetical protein